MVPRASYGGRAPAHTGGGVVARVEANSPFARAGVTAGDTIVAVDGEQLRDIIDWQWLTDGLTASLTVRDPAGQVRDAALERHLGEPWGADFTEVVFDGVRTCRNRCAFCFMSQLPKGLRRALYLRDDDFRLSFLQGNFVTLTNLSDADIARIAEQNLSPLYVSVHSTEPEVRAQLVCAHEDRALERLDQLLEAGIDVHAQIVLVPGVNDGDHLDTTLTWLAKREGVLSVGIVPLGFTSHQSELTGSFTAAKDAAAVIAQVEPWQSAFRERDGFTWVYLADEFYLNAGAPLPPREAYDDFPQYENGIGPARSFADEAAMLAPQLAEAVVMLPSGRRVSLVTGELFSPVLDELVSAVDPWARVAVLAVPNRFFGGNVSVAGLLTGQDILAALGQMPATDVALVPNVVANADGLLLDDVPASELGARSGKDVRLVSCDAGGLLQGLRGVAESPPPPKE